MNKSSYRFGGLVFAAAVLIGMSVSAASVLEVAYPVTELGGCADRAACRVYCADAAHTSACVDFGEKHGILNAAEAARARAVSKPGPGGCKDEGACKTYCQNPANQDECLAFSLKSGRISQETHDLLKKAQADGGPGGCRDEGACRTYCTDTSHAKECLNFAEKNGVVKKDAALKARQLGVLEGPGGCRGQESCRTYCSDVSHGEECLTFAERHNLLAPSEIAHARVLVSENGPGGCSGGEMCRAYCADAAHAEECLAFAEKNGIAPKEEIMRARKFLQATEQGGGPGGCTGEACRTFCEKPENREECLAFAKKNNLITAEQETHIESGMKLRAVLVTMGGPGGCTDENTCRTYCGDPMHAEECTAFAVAHGGVSQDVAHKMLQDFVQQKSEARGGTLSPVDLDRQTQGVEARFESFRQLEERFRGDVSSTSSRGTPPVTPNNNEKTLHAPRNNNTFHGPGGCSSPAACIQFCAEHSDVCSRPDKGNTGGDAGNSGGQGETGGQLPPTRDDQPSFVTPRLINPKNLPPDFNKKTPGEQRDIIRKLQIQLNPDIPPAVQGGQPPEVSGEKQRTIDDRAKQLELKRQSSGVGNQHPFGAPGRGTPPTTLPHDFRQQEYTPPSPAGGTNVYPGSREGHYLIPEGAGIPAETPNYSSGSGFVRPEPSFPPFVPPVPPPPTTIPPTISPLPSGTAPPPTSQTPLERFLASLFGLWQ